MRLAQLLGAPQDPVNQLSRREWLQTLTFRSALFIILWWILTAADTASWIIGIPTVIAATTVSLALFPTTPGRLRLYSCVRFAGFFLRESWRGGLDVAWRAVHPCLPLAPLLLECQLRLQDETARVFLANTLSLLPGTLSATLHDDSLIVHALTGTPDRVKAELRIVETYVADLFGLDLSSFVSLTE